jgi:trigger factor
MSTQVKVETQDEHSAKITLEIPAELANQEYNKAWKSLGKRLNIPGFRRGKAPKNMVEKAVGTERIKKEAMDQLFPHLFADAISEHQLDIIAPPRVESLNFDFSKGISVQAMVELRPVAEVPELTQLKIDIAPSRVLSEDAGQKELDILVSRYTMLEPVIDRPVVAQDIVNIDFKGSIDGEPIKGGAAKGYRLDLASNTFIEGFAEQLVGHSLGEEFTIQVTFPEAYHDESLSGKQGTFEVKVNEISKKIVPEINDELAKKTGIGETLEQLKEEIAKQLKESEEVENLYIKQKAVVEYLLEHSTVALPESMVTRETSLLKEEVEQRLKAQGLTWEKFIGLEGTEQTWANLRKEASKRIKTSLVFGCIAKQEGISVSEEDFMDAVSEMAAMKGLEERQVIRQLANNYAAAQSLSDLLLSQKIVSILCERTEFNIVDRKDVETAAENPVAGLIEGEEFDVIENED